MVGHTGRFLSAAQRVGEDFPKTLFVVGIRFCGCGRERHVDRLRQHAVRLSDGRAGGPHEQDRQGRVGQQPRRPAQRRRAGRRLPEGREKRQAGHRGASVIYIKGMEDAAEAKEAALSLDRRRWHRLHLAVSSMPVRPASSRPPRRRASSANGRSYRPHRRLRPTPCSPISSRSGATCIRPATTAAQDGVASAGRQVHALRPRHASAAPVPSSSVHATGKAFNAGRASRRYRRD